MQNVTAGRFPACLHAVEKASFPRLGIVYEMQPIGGKALDQADAEPVCICTASAPIKGLGGLCVVQIFTMPCSCSEMNERGAGGRRMDKRRKGPWQMSAACNSKMMQVRVFNVTEEDVGDQDDADEGESVGVQSEDCPRRSPLSSQHALDSGDADGAGYIEAADHIDGEDEKILHVARPLCNDASCLHCQCCRHDEVEVELPPNSGELASVCRANLEKFAQEIVANLEYKSGCQTLVLKTPTTSHL